MQRYTQSLSYVINGISTLIINHNMSLIPNAKVHTIIIVCNQWHLNPYNQSQHVINPQCKGTHNHYRM